MTFKGESEMIKSIIQRDKNTFFKAHKDYIFPEPLLEKHNGVYLWCNDDFFIAITFSGDAFYSFFVLSKKDDFRMTCYEIPCTTILPEKVLNYFTSLCKTNDV